MAQKRSAKKFILDNWVRALSLLIVLGVGGYFGVYKQLQIRQEKKNFTAAQASIDQLFSQIEAKIGKPDQVKHENKCSYTNEEFGGGARSCDVSINALYENKNASQSSNLMHTIASIVGNSPLRNGVNGPGIVDFVSTQNNQSFDQTYKTVDHLPCAVSFSYPVSPTYLSDSFQTTFKENLKIELGCGGPAKAEHFPVKNQ